MPTPSTAKWPKPRSEDEFEDIVVDFVRVRWKDPNAQRHGRRGQKQRGVDIVGRPPRLKGKTVAGQCKNTDVLTLGDVVEEVEKAKRFPGGLAEFYVITSGDRDAKLQVAVRKHFKVKPAPFDVEVVFWSDVVADLAEHPDLVWKHWKGFGKSASRRPLRPTIDALDLRVRWDEELQSMEQFYQRVSTSDHVWLAREMSGWDTPFWTTRKRVLKQVYGDREWWIKTTELYQHWNEAKRGFPTLERVARGSATTGFRMLRAAERFKEAVANIAYVRRCLVTEAELESIAERDRADAILICEAGAQSGSAGIAQELRNRKNEFAIRLAVAAWNYCCDAQPREQDARAAELLRSGWVPSVEVMMIGGRGASPEFDRLRKTKGLRRG